jgi:hypothetical protein
MLTSFYRPLYKRRKAVLTASGAGAFGDPLGDQRHARNLLSALRRNRQSGRPLLRRILHQGRRPEKGIKEHSGTSKEPKGTFKVLPGTFSGTFSGHSRSESTAGTKDLTVLVFIAALPSAFAEIYPGFCPEPALDD